MEGPGRQMNSDLRTRINNMLITITIVPSGGSYNATSSTNVSTIYGTNYESLLFNSQIETGILRVHRNPTLSSFKIYIFEIIKAPLLSFWCTYRLGIDTFLLK